VTERLSFTSAEIFQAAEDERLSPFVGFGSFADIAAALPNVRFTLESGRHRKPS